MRFVKLTEHENGNQLWINVSLIEAILLDDGFTRLNVIGDSLEQSYHVTESPEEIMRLIEEHKPC